MPTTSNLIKNNMTDPSSSTADLRGLGIIALSAAVANAAATQAALANAAAHTSGGRARRLFRACADKYGEARDQLVGVQKEYESDTIFVVDDAADLADECRMMYRRYPAELARRDMALDCLCAIAMDMVQVILSHLG